MGEQQGGGSSFCKMRLVPFGDYSNVTLKSLRNYDPALNAMAHSLVHARKARAKRSDLSAAAGLRNAYMQRFKALSMQRKGGRPEVHDDGAMVDRAPGVVGNLVDAWRDIRQGDEVQVPHQFQRRADRLVAALAIAPPGSVGRTNHDELVIDGNVLRGTSYADAFRALFVNTTHLPVGTRLLVRKLQQLQVSPNLISSRYARNIYNQGGGGTKRIGRRRVAPVTHKAPRALRVYRR